MVTNKIIYGESIELIVLGSTRWRKVGIEAELEPGEDVVEASKELKKTIDKIHAQNNVDIDVPPAPPQRVKIDPMISRMKTLIDAATSKKEMDGYSASCPRELQEYFTAKYKKLKK